MNKKEDDLKGKSPFLGYNFNFGPNGPDYDSLENKLSALKDLMRITTDVIFVKDLYNNTFPLYGGDFFTTLGHAVEDFELYGAQLFYQMIDKDELNHIRNYQDEYCDFIKEVDVVLRESVVLFQLLHFKLPNNSIQKVCLRICPLLYDKDSKPWVVLVKFSLAPKSYEFPTHIQLIKTGEAYLFDKKTKSFILGKVNSLTLMEQKVLVLSARGLKEKESAKELSLSHNTIKKHKANILKKYNVNNISEAFVVASNLNQL